MDADQEYLKLAIERAGEIMVYWNILIAVSLGLLGFFASGKELAANTTLKVIASIAFAVFAVSNFDAMWQLNRQREELCKLIDAPQLARLVAELRPDEPWMYAAFHALMDIAVICGLWLIKPPTA